LKKFNFKKFIRRNDFTGIFGGVGTRRTLLDFANKKRFRLRWIRFKIVKTRRAHQGWRNKTFGSLYSLKTRIKYGRRKSIGNFRI
tara:strand:+ start:1806 stop:2060 length:255 start_codon:yes stop_codon:yes gene_type:complete